jgi:hypothetical protein
MGEQPNTRDAHSREDAQPDKDETEHASREDIRSRLRKWSEEQSLSANTSEPPVLTHNTIPPNNSIFHKEAEPQDDEQPFEIDQDNFDTEDDVTTVINYLGLEPGDVFFGHNL